MSVVDDVRKVYEERDEYKRAYEELKQHCQRKVEEATTKLVLADENNKRLKAENERLSRELAQARRGGRMMA